MRTLHRNYYILWVAILLGFGGSGPAWAAEPAPVGRDVLVFQDGDRVQGKLVERTGDTLVHSDRFGVLRVPAGSVTLIPAVLPAAPSPVPAAPVAAPAPAAAAPAAVAAATGASAAEASLARFAEKLLATFQPWTGRFTVSTEIVNDSAERSNFSTELQLHRKWTADDLQLKARYDYNKVNGKATTDLWKADGLVHHDFSPKVFLLYRPVLEWSRASYTNGVPSDYVLLQQEIGLGTNLAATKTNKVRTGVAENLFGYWNVTADGSSSSHTAESLFLEIESKLPWNMLFVQRGSYYYSFATSEDGWENRIDLSKKFTKTLNTGIRYEVRQGSPDGTALDYTRLRLVFGLDF
jgi:hypothetical protein